MMYAYTLVKLHSKRDVYGNTYWALRFTDHSTGQTVEGTVSGGESNIDSLRFGWDEPNRWSDKFLTRTEERPIREFNRLTKNWEHAGCTQTDLQTFIKSRLSALANA